MILILFFNNVIQEIKNHNLKNQIKNKSCLIKALGNLFNIVTSNNKDQHW